MADASAEKNVEAGPPPTAPFQRVLEATVGKLSSEILLFLIAYTILLIGIAVFGSSLETALRELLYFIPVLGVIAYVWLRSRQLRRRAREEFVRVDAAMTIGGARVIGVLGPDTPDRPVRVATGFTSGAKTEVVGVLTPDRNADLNQIANELVPSSRIKLLQRAQELLDQQSATPGPP